MQTESLGKWQVLPKLSTINKAISALKANNISAELVQTEEEARLKALSLLPKGAEVMDMTSVTLGKLELDEEIHSSGNYNSVKNKLMKLDRVRDGLEMQKLGAAPEYAIGSVHAVTEDGKVVIASNTGSQLPAYSYGASHVVWIVGVQKIVKDLSEAFKRINEYTLELESERMKKAYGVERSFVSKLLIFNRETKPDRIKMILINRNIGF